MKLTKLEDVKLAMLDLLTFGHTLEHTLDKSSDLEKSTKVRKTGLKEVNKQ